MEKRYQNRFEDRIETDQPIHLVFDPRCHGSLVILLEGEQEAFDLYLDAGDSADVKVFIQNGMKKPASLHVRSQVEQQARVQIGLLDLQEYPLDLTLDGNLNQPGASMEIYTAQLCLKDALKKGSVEITSHAAHTSGIMHNFAVCFDGGQYEMVASGRIDKGASDSDSHQETRVLTMGKDHQTKVIPILYIDENDVKASHALTIGQPDAQQLYYLQSRGLNARQAMGLLSIGYFKPVLSLIDQEQLRLDLEMETERRVGLHENS